MNLKRDKQTPRPEALPHIAALKKAKALFAEREIYQRRITWPDK